MITLQDREYNDLIRGYLQCQLHEWFDLKAKLYEQLNLSLNDEIEIIILKVMEYLPVLLLQYLKGEISQENLEKQVKKAIVLMLNIHFFAKKPNNKSLNSLKDLIWLYIQKIFLDFESPQEFKGIIHRGYQAAKELKMPLDKAFWDPDHYHHFIRRSYSSDSFRQKLKGMLSIFSTEKLAKDFNLKLTAQNQSQVEETLKIADAIELVIQNKIQMVFQPHT